ncbi:NUDIX domain-containing protein [Kushneria aurantia]|uniref:NUDIX domain-containing protein n=1 Tax=Kushneria aurantia TaxID=504092 RepID=A0ABV6G0Q8_9GAMM|nr:NUDIX hydrolase [Kushneria aurantia]
MSDFSPHATVAVVVERNGRFLLVEEWPRRDATTITVFNQPAGHLEADESLTAAARRECLEESGWRVGIDSYLGLYINTAPSGVVYHSHTFIARPLTQASHRLDDGVVAAHWLTAAEIVALDGERRLRSPLVARRVKDALSGKRYPLALIHNLDHAETP